MLSSDALIRYWRYCLLIENDLEATSRFVDFQSDNYRTFSSEFSKIILLACSEIDVICRLLCKEIETDFNERKSAFDDYTRIILNRFPKLVECSLKIRHNKSILNPFEEWKITPYSSPKWWKDYQAIKHSRHNNFEQANLYNSLSSVAGLIVLNLYLFRLVTNENYANPSPYPSVFDGEYFSPFILARANKELPDFACPY